MSELEIWIKIARAWVLGVVVTLHVGCAYVGNAAPGMAESDVLARFGPPDASTPQADGTQRLVYSTAPFGQQAFAVIVRDASVVAVNQVLTRQEFAQVRVGTDTRETVMARFGRPAESEYLRLSQREAWGYRLRLDDVFPMMMNVLFDREGVVRDIFPTEDLMFDPHDGNH